MKEVGKRLKALRESIGISQVKMAEAIGSTQSSVNRYENGQSTPPVELFRRYADYFDVSLDYIFARTDKPQGVTYEFKPKATQMCIRDSTVTLFIIKVNGPTTTFQAIYTAVTLTRKSFWHRIESCICWLFLHRHIK